MQFLRTLKRETLVDIIDGVLSLIVLALSVEMFKAWSNEAEHLVQISTAFFLSLAGYRFIHAFLIRADSKMDFIRDIIAGCLLLVCTILLIAKGNGPNVMTTVGKLYFTVILVEAFFSILQNHSITNIILNLLVVGALVALGPSVLVIVLIRIVHALRDIIRIAYSSMKLDIFWQVVRKTNAAEILFGMLLLIIAFSLVLPILEDDIPDFASALWYCFAIISTIGFGDVAAVSILGRAMSAILGLCGLVVVSVIMSIVVNFYNETKDTDDDADDKATDRTSNALKKAQPLNDNGDDALPDRPKT